MSYSKQEDNLVKGGGKKLTTQKHSPHRRCVYNEVRLEYASSPGKWHTDPQLHLPALVH